jgi:hypothetical protein
VSGTQWVYEWVQGLETRWGHVLVQVWVPQLESELARTRACQWLAAESLAPQWVWQLVTECTHVYCISRAEMT